MYSTGTVFELLMLTARLYASSVRLKLAASTPSFFAKPATVLSQNNSPPLSNIQGLGAGIANDVEDGELFDAAHDSPSKIKVAPVGSLVRESSLATATSPRPSSTKRYRPSIRLLHRRKNPNEDRARSGRR